MRAKYIAVLLPWVSSDLSGEHLSQSIFLKYLEEWYSVTGEYLENFYLQWFSIEECLLTKQLQCYIVPWCRLFTQAYKQKMQEGAVVTLSHKKLLLNLLTPQITANSSTGKKNKSKQILTSWISFLCISIRWWLGMKAQPEGQHMQHKIMESFRLEETFKIIETNYKCATAKSASKPWLCLPQYYKSLRQSLQMFWKHQEQGSHMPSCHHSPFNHSCYR